MQGSKFDRVVASAYRVEEKTVRHFARLLKEAGLLTTGARGVNAPHMLPRDAARITIALLATDRPARAVDRVNRFRGLTYRPERSKGSHPEALGIADGVTLEEVLTNVFSNLGVYDSAPYVEVRENHRTATIKHGDGEVFFSDVHRPPELVDSDAKELLGIRHARGAASADMLLLAVAFETDREAEQSQ